MPFSSQIAPVQYLGTTVVHAVPFQYLTLLFKTTVTLLVLVTVSPSEALYADAVIVKTYVSPGVSVVNKTVPDVGVDEDWEYTVPSPLSPEIVTEYGADVPLPQDTDQGKSTEAVRILDADIVVVIAIRHQSTHHRFEVCGLHYLVQLDPQIFCGSQILYLFLLLHIEQP